MKLPEVKSKDRPEKLWYAIYCRSRNEKKVNELLQEAGVETFLPLLKTRRQWSDRKKWIVEPLFRSYIFVNITKDEYRSVLQIDGVVRFVTFEGKAVEVPLQQIKAIRQFLDNEEDLSLINENLKPGDSVEIFRGSLRGLNGKLTEIRGKQKVLVEIESIGRTIVLTIPKSYLQPLKRK